MNGSSDQHTGLGWLHGLPIVVIGVLAMMLWRPAADPAPSLEQEAKIADLAERLGRPAASVGEIDDRLRSFGPFPPDGTASRALAAALVTCATGRLDELRRTQLARRLYGITVIGDSRDETLPEALIALQQLAAAAGCSPAAVDEMTRAARDVAAMDPSPRRDWW